MDIGEIVWGITLEPRTGNPAAQAGLGPEPARSALGGVPEHCNGGGSLEGLAETVGERGSGQNQVQAFVPQVLPMLQGHAENSDEGVQSVLRAVS